MNFAILGAGRIGQVHARAIAANERATLVAISDPISEAENAVASRYGCQPRTIEEIAADPAIDAVVICTPTDTHANLIELFAKHAKAVFCEKPIDLDSARAKLCLETVQACGTTLMIGFNRRFDPHFMALKQAIRDGEIGNPEMAVITSRDPAPPPIDYINKSGGLFKDMMIHDFDMIIFLMDELPVAVQAAGSVLTDKAIEAAGDFDSASALLTMASGRQAVITNSRRATYGYDQRIEVHGQKGMISAENQRPVSIELATDKGFVRPVLHNFFMNRYLDAYALEIASFVEVVNQKAAPSPSGIDGYNALRIAEAALESAQTGDKVAINY